MDFSKGLQAELEKAGLTAEQKMFADLVLMGWKDADAFIAVFGYNVNYSVNYMKAQIKKAKEDMNVASYLATASARSNSVVKSKAEKDDILSRATKEQTLKELIVVRDEKTPGSREWLDMTKLITDLQQMKKDVVAVEDTTVHTYLPLKCRDCAAYAEYVKRKKRERRKGSEE